jgi:hypothetical protein
MGLETEIVQDVVIEEGGVPEAAKDDKPYNPTNPIFEVKPEEEPEKKEEAKPEPKAEEQPKPEEKKEDPIPKGVQKRIDRAVREKYEAQAEAKMLKERLDRIEQNIQERVAKPIDNSEPRIDNFDDFDKYVAAKAEWIASKKINETLNERERRSAEERAAAAHYQAVDGWNQRLEKATAELPDFKEVIESSDVPMSDFMRDAIVESDLGPKVAYWLANNPDEAKKIASMSPLATVKAIGRIEERLESQAKAPKKPTAAPAPLKPVGGKASVQKDPGQMTDAEYAEWRKKGRA